MEPYRPGGAGGVRGGRPARPPDGFFRELLRVAELFDTQVRVLEGGIAQPETKFESWGNLFLVMRNQQHSHDKISDVRRRTNDSQ